MNIELFVENGVWVAKSAQYATVFDTDEIYTPYLSSMDSGEVLERIKKLNRGATVTLRGIRKEKAKSYREVLIALADDYQNNYLSPERFAEANGLSTYDAVRLIELAQQVRAKPHPES